MCTADPLETTFLYQRISVAIQRFNAVCLDNSLTVSESSSWPFQTYLKIIIIINDWSKLSKVSTTPNHHRIYYLDAVCAVLEDEKVLLQNELTTVCSSLRDIESRHKDTERHRRELELDLKSAETERNLLTANVSDLQMNLAQTNDKLERLTIDNLALKQKVAT